MHMSFGALDGAHKLEPVLFPIEKQLQQGGGSSYFRKRNYVWEDSACVPISVATYLRMYNCVCGYLKWGVALCILLFRPVVSA